MSTGQRRSFRRVMGAVCFGMLAAAGACHHGVEVRTIAAPDAKFAGRQTFRLLPLPEYRGSIQLASNDPMLVNSITNQALRDEIRRALEAKGYRYSPEAADFDVAFYASAAQKLDIRSWNYGYTWLGFPRVETEVIPYEEGSVIIDVVDPMTHRLLWRGQGRAVTSEDPNKYISDLKKAVREIIDKFPSPS